MLPVGVAARGISIPGAHRLVPGSCVPLGEPQPLGTTFVLLWAPLRAFGDHLQPLTSTLPCFSQPYSPLPLRGPSLIKGL